MSFSFVNPRPAKVATCCRNLFKQHSVSTKIKKPRNMQAPGESPPSPESPRTIDLHSGNSLVIEQTYVGDVNSVVWDSALVLAKLISYCSKRASWPKVIREPKKMLELGAGTGAVSIVAAECGIESIATDLQDRMELIDRNIKRNAAVLSESCTGLPFNWADGKTKLQEIFTIHPDIETMVLCDGIYYRKGMEYLQEVFSHLLELSPNLQIIVAYEDREEHAKLVDEFLVSLINMGYLYTELWPEDLDPEWRSDDIHVLIVRKCDVPSLSNLMKVFPKVTARE